MGVPVVVGDVGADGYDSSLLMVSSWVWVSSCTVSSRSGEERTDGGMLPPPLSAVSEDGERWNEVSTCEMDGRFRAKSGIFSGLVVVVVVVVVVKVRE